MKLPKKIDIMSTIYDVKYFDKVSDVDIEGKTSLVGQICYQEEIRIWVKRPHVAVFKTLLHEIIHGVADELKIVMGENEVDRFANGMADTLIRNKMVRL